jgi:hypothetical protein
LFNLKNLLSKTFPDALFIKKKFNEKNHPILPEASRLSVSEPYELRRDIELPSGSCKSILRDGLTLIKEKAIKNVHHKKNSFLLT